VRHPAPRLPVDHLVWGGRVLEEEIDRLETLLGVRASPGGQHPGEGTHNAIIRLGPAVYLELIAPDPGQRPPVKPRWFTLDSLRKPRLVTWAAAAPDLEARVLAARRTGIPVGEVRHGERRRPDGGVLSWRFTYPDLRVGNGLVPFLIDWGRGRHPAESAPGGVKLAALRAEHPDPATIPRMLRGMGINLDVSIGPEPALVATVESPRGRVELR